MSKQKPIKPVVNKSGVSLGGLIFVVFLTLKLAGIGQVATWSWWWVTSPLWISVAIYLVIVLGAVAIGLLGLIIMGIGNLLVKYLRSEPTGYLNISSTPTSKIVLDGKVLGDTPKMKVKVTPGIHQVIFIDNDGNRFEKSVLAIAGQNIPVSHKF
jgi:hypothetical protein